MCMSVRVHEIKYIHVRTRVFVCFCLCASVCVCVHVLMSDVHIWFTADKHQHSKTN